MKTYYKSLCMISLSSYMLLQNACTSSSTADIEKLDWMRGKWQSTDANGALYESWEKENGYTLKGNAFAIENGDTTFSEYAQIVKKGDKVYYSVTVNNEVTTDFLLVKNADTVVFENKQHDFPQRILYAKNGEDSLYARTEGIVDGVLMKEEYRYGKAK